MAHPHCRSPLGLLSARSPMLISSRNNITGQTHPGGMRNQLSGLPSTHVSRTLTRAVSHAHLSGCHRAGSRPSHPPSTLPRNHTAFPACSRFAQRCSLEIPTARPENALCVFRTGHVSFFPFILIPLGLLPRQLCPWVFTLPQHHVCFSINRFYFIFLEQF